MAVAGIWFTLLAQPDVSMAQQGQPKPIAFPPGVELPITETLAEEGWIALFDGKSLFGWRQESNANWRVERGMICVDQGDVGLLRTTSQFDDFRLYFEFKAGPGTNSGVFIRTSPQPTDPSVDCYEINIAPDSNPFPTGSLVGRTKSAECELSDEFNSMLITATGSRIQVQVNDQLVADYVDPRPLGRGYIGLQLNSGPVCFRSIRLLPLNGKDLLSGELLSGWTPVPSLPGKFQMTPDGSLHGSGGRGSLESRARYGDFVLQLRCRTEGRDQNSGVFFRCVPGSEMDGYESQIDHGYDRVRKTPTDSGTGGIFGRTNARQVVTDENAWFAKTIVACGPHISVWVNGYQVSDWTDKRPAHENPRRGRRVAAGTIMLQSHDPSTSVFFTNIRVKELAPRGR